MAPACGDDRLVQHAAHLTGSRGAQALSEQLLAEDAADAVGADQDHVAVKERDGLQDIVDVPELRHAEIAGQRRFLGIVLGGGAIHRAVAHCHQTQAGIHILLAVKVIDAVAALQDQVAVADARVVQPLAVENTGDAGAAALGAEGREDLVVRANHAVTKPRGDIGGDVEVLEVRLDARDRRFAGEFAVTHAAHTVGDDGEQSALAHQRHIGDVREREGILLAGAGTGLLELSAVVAQIMRDRLFGCISARRCEERRLVLAHRVQPFKAPRPRGRSKAESGDSNLYIIDYIIQKPATPVKSSQKKIVTKRHNADCRKTC